MFDVDAFVIQGHQKVIGHYRWLRDATASDVEREWIRSADAVTRVLNAVPEGWTAALLSNRVKPVEVEVLDLQPGKVRDISLHRHRPDPKTN
jgi:hypothetical protein